MQPGQFSPERLSPEQLSKDEFFMQQALELAVKAAGRTSPNPMVGAVVVNDGRVVGRGYHLKAGTPHAEVHALRDAGKLAVGATIYVTLEPCCHYGRTPPCTEAIIKAGIRRVVVAMTDPNPLVAGDGLKILHDAGIEVTCGIFKEQAEKINEVFIKYITKKVPFVSLKAAVSLDGKIATVTGESQWITGPESREFGHYLRDKHDGIVVGINTVLADDPSLTTRLPKGEGRDPVRIVLDSKCRTPLDAKIINQPSKAGTIIVTTKQADKQKIKALEEKGAEVIVCGEGPRVDVPEMLKQLAAREISSLLVEGGASVHAAFLANNVVDKVYWFIAPILIGGKNAPGAVGDPGIEKLKDAVKLRVTLMHKFDKDICIEGYVDRGGVKSSLPESWKNSAPFDL